MVFTEERNDGLDDKNYRADHLRNSLDFAKQTGRNDYTAAARNNKPETRYTKLAKKNYKNNPHEDQRERCFTAEYHPYEYGNHG